MLIFKIGKNAGPVSNTALRARDSLLRFLKFAFGSAHALALGLLELWICAHTVFKIYNVLSGLSRLQLDRLTIDGKVAVTVMMHGFQTLLRWIGPSFDYFQNKQIELVDKARFDHLAF